MDRSIADMLNLFYDMRAHVTFDESFKTNFELEDDTPEEQIYDMLR